MTLQLSPKMGTGAQFSFGPRRQLESKAAMLSLDPRRVVRELDEMTGLLSRVDPPSSPLLNSLDLKAQDLSTYFFAAYSDCLDMERSLSVYKTVKMLVRYILLSDRYFETGNQRLYRLARGMLSQAKDNLNDRLKHSISYSIRQFTPFWQFEQMMSKRMVSGETFSLKDVMHHNLFKSSDSSLIYAQVLESELPTFDQTVATVIHYNQALQDIFDDLSDIEEDVTDKMPNVFLLASVSFVKFSKLAQLEPARARETVLNSGGAAAVSKIAQTYMDSIERIELPTQYSFLRNLSKHYLNMINVGLSSRFYEKIITS